MTQHKYKIFILPLIILQILFAGTSGKIVGRVIDNETLEPLIGCNVIIEGTALGAATDINGEYLILNVPPGIYEIKAMMIGYTTVNMKNVDVVVDLTTRADFAMGMEVIGGQEVTVIAQKPIVRLDQTSMAAVMGAADIENLPVTEISELIELQAGVVKDPGGGLHIRGGRSGEVSFWVDGVSVTDAYDASMGLEVEKNAVQELQVISGTFNAEYGNAMSGIVNIVTKDGGEKYRGGIDIYGGGYHTFDNTLYTLSSPFADWKRYEDLNGNGAWDSPEWFNDKNRNLQWDPGEPFDDVNENGIWDAGEPLNSDVGPDGRPGDPTDNGSMSLSATSNNNGQKNEPSIGEGDGIMQWGEHNFSLNDGGYLDKVNVLLNPLQIKNLQGFLSGPVPFFKRWLTFYTTFRYFNTQNWYYGKRLFNPLGTDEISTFGDGEIAPLIPFAKMSGQIKLTFKPLPLVKLSYSLYYDEKEYKRYDDDNPFTFKYNPDGILNRFEKDISHIFSLTHTLTPRTYYEVKVIDFSSSYWEYLYKDADNVPFQEQTVTNLPILGDTVTISTTLDTIIIPRYEIIDSILTITTNGDSIWKYTIIDYSDMEGYVDPEIMNNIPAWSYAAGGTQGGRFERNTSYNMLKFDLSSQVNKYNQTKLGLEIKLYDLWADDKSIQYKNKGEWGLTADGDTIGFNPLAGSRYEGFEYIPTILPTYSSTHNYFRVHPKQISAYIQDKLELDDLIINFGIRYDYFNPDWIVPKNDRFPANRKYYLATTTNDTIVFWEHDYSELNNGVTIVDSLTSEGANKVESMITSGETNLAVWNNMRDTYRWTYGYKKAPTSSQLSPRIGLSYPITDKGAIHVSYGHFFQIPNFSYLYENPEFEVERTEAYQDDRIIGNAALQPERTVKYEVGFMQEIAPFTSFDLTLFYQDTRDWVGVGAPIDKYPVGSYYKYENRDYSNTRGFTIAVNRSYVQGFGASVSYSWMVAEGTYSNPTDAYFDAQDNDEPIISLIPLDWDQMHTLNASVTLGGSFWNSSLIAQYWSGKPYTPEFKVGAVSGAAAFSGFSENSDRNPNYLNIDLRTSFFLNIFGLKPTIYINIYNLFDIRNELNVWGDTGRATYTLTAKDVPETDITRIGNLHEQLHKPDWYSEPRKINIGLSLNF